MSIKIDNEFLDYIEEQVLELKKAIDGQEFCNELLDNPIFNGTFDYDEMCGEFGFNYKDLTGSVYSIGKTAYICPCFEFHDHDFWFNFEYIEE